MKNISLILNEYTPGKKNDKEVAIGTYAKSNIQYSQLSNLEIYLRAISRMMDLLKLSKEQLELANKSLKRNDPVLGAQQMSEFMECATKATNFAEEFKKGCSVVHDEVAVELFSLLYKRFDFIIHKIDTYVAFQKIQNCNEAISMLERCVGTFEKMRTHL